MTPVSARAEGLPRGNGGAAPLPLVVPIALRFAMLSATILFGAALYAYFAARTGRLDSYVTSGQRLAHIQMPVWFWFSTFTILVSSLSLWGSKRFAENHDPRLARRALFAATGLGYLFLLLQIPGFLGLLEQHRAAAGEKILVYAIVAILFALHAGHVLGGIIPLTIVSKSTAARPLVAERIPTLRYLGWYWHYLALVWFVIWNVLMLAG